MGEILIVFIVGAVTSFVGSIPPGTLNLSVLQLGLEGKTKIAWRFALAVAIVEYPYAWLAIQFEQMITSNPLVVQNFQLITATVITAIGIMGILSARKPSAFSRRFEASGFRRGIVLSILNPMAIPWWIGVIAYEKANGLNISTSLLVHSFVLGTAIGVLLLLAAFILLARRLSGYAAQKSWIRFLPGFILLALGIIAFGQYFLKQ